MIAITRLESGICKGPGFASASVHLVFFVLSASETGLLLVVKLGRTVVMMRADVKIMPDVRKTIKKVCACAQAYSLEGTLPLLY